MSFHIIIPARFASTRLPGKPLADVEGKPLVQRVYECAMQSSAKQTVVATDDERIASVVRSFGGQVCMTSTDHPTGTDRLIEVIEKLKIPEDEIVVNLQGDEPLMPSAVIDQVAQNLARYGDAVTATVSTPIDEPRDLFDPHVVKVVSDVEGYALYFSRAPIPWHRSEFAENHALPAAIGNHYQRHIGLYAYWAGFLPQFVTWPPCELEKVESLEQLRILWNGLRIHVAEAVQVPGHGVDTPADLERVRAQFRSGRAQ